jgi:hypothetical protein
MFTKGKWEVSSGILVCSEEAKIVANCMPVGVPKLDIPFKDAVANAKRICHCVNNFDDLLDACKKLLKKQDDDSVFRLPNNCPEILKLREAIAKAEGK